MKGLVVKNRYESQGMLHITLMTQPCTISVSQKEAPEKLCGFEDACEGWSMTQLKSIFLIGVTALKEEIITHCLFVNYPLQNQHCLNFQNYNSLVVFTQQFLCTRDTHTHTHTPIQ